MLLCFRCTFSVIMYNKDQQYEQIIFFFFFFGPSKFVIIQYNEDYGLSEPLWGSNGV